MEPNNITTTDDGIKTVMDRLDQPDFRVQEQGPIPWSEVDLRCNYCARQFHEKFTSPVIRERRLKDLAV